MPSPQLVSPPPKVAFVGDRRFELGYPKNCSWAASSFVPVEASWTTALAQAAAMSPAVSVLFNPFAAGADDLRRVGGLKIGVVTRALSSEEGRQLRALCAMPAGLKWLTWFAEVSLDRNSLRILGILPSIVDTARVVEGPSLNRWEIAIAGFPPPEFNLHRSCSRLSSTCAPQFLMEMLSRSGILLYYSENPVDVLDPVIVLALTFGHLLITNNRFSRLWGLESEEDYLVRPVRVWRKTIQAVQEGPEDFREVRVRAWQKARELLDASKAFQRLITDALLLER